MKFRAIVIDDDETCRSLLAMLLQQRGYEVICLPDPTACPLFEDAGCTCLQEEVCGDFLLTDNRMPGMSGLEFVDRQVRGGCKGIVGNKAVLSGGWQPAELAEADRLGCQVFHKPYQIQEITAWLDRRERFISADRKLVDFGCTDGEDRI